MPFSLKFKVACCTVRWLQDQTLVASSADGKLSLWDLVSPTPTLAVSVLTYSARPVPTGTVSCLAVTPTGLLVSGSHDGGVAVWRVGYNQPSTVT
jgi:WD40 repeat protein